MRDQNIYIGTLARSSAQVVSVHLHPLRRAVRLQLIDQVFERNYEVVVVRGIPPRVAGNCSGVVARRKSTRLELLVETVVNFCYFLIQVGVCVT